MTRYFRSPWARRCAPLGSSSIPRTSPRQPTTQAVQETPPISVPRSCGEVGKPGFRRTGSPLTKAWRQYYRGLGRIELGKIDAGVLHLREAIRIRIPGLWFLGMPGRGSFSKSSRSACGAGVGSRRPTRFDGRGERRWGEGSSTMLTE